MAAHSCLDILDRLALGNISPEQAVRQIEMLKEKEKQQTQGLHKRFFSCVTIRVRPAGRLGVFFKVPVGLLNFCLFLVGLNPKIRQKFREQGISLREVHALVRFLKYREAGFDIRVEAKDGTKVLVYN